jgi:hypothetical protein
MTSRFLLSACLLFACACASATGLAGNDDISIRRDGDHIVLTTSSATPFYYFVVDEAVLPLILWGPCAQPVGCPSVQRNSPARIALADLRLRSSSNTSSVALFYWRLMPKGEGFVPDSIRSTGIRIEYP